MLGSKAGTQLVSSDSTRRISLQGIVSRAYLIVQPAFDSSITRQERT